MKDLLHGMAALATRFSMFGQIIMFGQVDNSYGRLCPSAGDSV